MPTENKKFTIVQQAGGSCEMAELMEAGRLLLKFGYTVRRVKVQRAGQKTLLNALEIREQNTLEPPKGG